MSLTYQQEKNTRQALKENFEKSGLTIEQIAADLKTTTAYLHQLFALKPKRLEDTWILRNYLIKKVEEKGLEVTPFTALAVDYHQIWFLNSHYIDKGIIRSR